MESNIISLKEYKDNNKYRARKPHIPLTAKEELEIWKKYRHYYDDQDYIDRRIKELKEKIKRPTKKIIFLQYEK